MEPSISEPSIASYNGIEQQPSSDEEGTSSEVCFMDLCHQLPFQALQQHLGGQDRPISGLRAASKAGLELVNDLITESEVRLRPLLEANLCLAKYVSKLHQLKALKLLGSSAADYQSRLEFDFWPEEDNTPLNQFVEALSGQQGIIKQLDVSNWVLTATAAQALMDKFPGVEHLRIHLLNELSHAQSQLFQQLSNWATLRSIVISTCAQDITAAISLLTQVTQLCLGQHWLGSVSSLSGLTNLHSLSLPTYFGASFQEGLLDVLQQLTDLQDLRVHGLEQSDVDAMSNLAALTCLSFETCKANGSVPSLPSLREVHSADTAGVARVLAACPHVEVVNLGHKTWKFQYETPESAPVWPFDEPVPSSLQVLSDEENLDRLQGLGTIDAWLHSNPRAAVTVDKLVINQVDKSNFGDFLTSPALQMMPPVYFFKRLELDRVSVISQNVIDFVAAKLPCLTCIQIRDSQFVGVVSLLPLVRLRLMRLDVMNCMGICMESVYAVQDAFDAERPGQVTLTFLSNN